MDIFNFFRNTRQKKNTIQTSTEVPSAEEILSSIPHSKDYLGKAAERGHAAKAAIRDRKFDTAWKMLHEQKMLYAKHAKSQHWTAKDVLCLDGSVSEDLANILRLETKHHQAFAHILYWIITSKVSIKRHQQKLSTYLKRCKFKNITLETVEKFIEPLKENPDFSLIQTKVEEWKNT